MQKSVLSSSPVLPRLLVGDSASPRAKPASRGGLLLPALVLAAEQVAASDLAVPAAARTRGAVGTAAEAGRVTNAGLSASPAADAQEERTPVRQRHQNPEAASRRAALSLVVRCAADAGGDT